MIETVARREPGRGGETPEKSWPAHARQHWPVSTGNTILEDLSTSSTAFPVDSVENSAGFFLPQNGVGSGIVERKGLLILQRALYSAEKTGFSGQNRSGCGKLFVSTPGRKNAEVFHR